MARAEEWIGEGAREYLEEGEEIVAAIVAQPRGRTQSVAGGLALGDAKEARNVAAGEQASPCTVEDAMGTAWVAEAATLSAREHRPVRIDEVAR